MKRNEIKELKNEKFKIVSKIWTSTSGDVFIYRIYPKKDSKMKPHKKYKTYSVVAFQDWNTGFDVDADISVFMKDGSETYEIKRVNFKWPESSIEQWNFLERFSNNNNYRRIYHKIDEKYGKYIKILDEITNNVESNNGNTLKLFNFLELSERDYIRFSNFYDSLSKLKSSSNIISLLPEYIRELFTDNQILKIAKLNDDPKKCVDLFLEQPFIALKLDGFGFKGIDKIRSKLSIVYPDNEDYKDDNPIRVYFAAINLINENSENNGNTYIALEEFKDKLIYDLRLDRKIVNEVLKSEFVQFNRLKFSNEKLVITSNDEVTTKKLYDAEYSNFELINSNYKIEPFNNFSKLKDEFIKNNCKTMSEEQKLIFDSINSNKITIVVGPGGVGKTWAISKVIDFLKTSLNKIVKLTAPTGKAAQNLSRYSNYEASTIHKLFNITSTSNNSVQVNMDVLIIDEYSMVDTELQYLINKSISSNENLRIIIVGDEDQLPSVGPGNLLHSFIESKLVNVIKLTKVFRVDDESGGISKLSKNLRNGTFPYKNNNGKIFSIGNDLAIQHYSDDFDILNRSLYTYNHMLEQGIDPSDIMVLTPKNKGLIGQVNLNNQIQKLVRTFFKKDENELCLTSKVFGKDVNFYIGDYILFNKNLNYPIGFDPYIEEEDVDYSKTVPMNNGDFGIITSLSDTAIIVSVNGEDYPLYIHKRSLDNISLGYAYTIHKSQGSQSKYGILLVSKSDSFMINANLLYTAVSRFKTRLYLFGDLNTIRYKSRFFINKTRVCLLDNFIKIKRD